MSDKRQDLHTRALKERDSWWTVLFVDAVTMPLLPLVMRIPRVTPMGITLTGLVIGVLSIASLGLGWLVVGALLFQLRYIVDCLDGKLARVAGQTSEFGRFADLSVDVFTVGFAYAALGIWASGSEIEGNWLTLVLLPSYAVAAWVHLYRRLALGEEERTTRPRQSATRVWSVSRLRPYPSSVEVETTLLVFYPLFLPDGLYPYVAGAAAVFYVVSAIDSFARVRRRLRRVAEVGGQS